MTLRIVNAAMLAVAAVSLAACAVTGGSEYGCKAPAGVRCNSVSGTYYNAIQNNLPSQRKDLGRAREGMSPVSEHDAPSSRGGAVPRAAMSGTPAGGLPSSAYAPMPLRTQDRVIRLWIKPWEDKDHDLWDQSYVFVRVDDGHWLIEDAQRRVQDLYSPLRPPAAASVEPRRDDQSATPAPLSQGPSADEAQDRITQALKALREPGGETGK
jgi:conjugal transfer pilus assembly protein TraV